MEVVTLQRSEVSEAPRNISEKLSKKKSRGVGDRGLANQKRVMSSPTFQPLFRTSFSVETECKHTLYIT